LNLLLDLLANALRSGQWPGVDSALGAEKYRSQKNTCKPRRLPQIRCTLCWVLVVDSKHCIIANLNKQIMKKNGKVQESNICFTN